jgi:hypothetical protein
MISMMISVLLMYLNQELSIWYSFSFYYFNHNMGCHFHAFHNVQPGDDQIES